MYRTELETIRKMSKVERRHLEETMERPTLDELRKMPLSKLATFALAMHEPNTLVDFWQLNGMIAARIQQCGEPMLATLIMDCGRAFDDETLVRIVQYLERRTDTDLAFMTANRKCARCQRDSTDDCHHDENMECNPDYGCWGYYDCCDSCVGLIVKQWLSHRQDDALREELELQMRDAIRPPL